MLGAVLGRLFGHVMQRAVIALSAAAAAILLFLIALGFFALAFDRWLATHTSAPMAALGTGASAILLAILIVAGVRLFRPRRARRSGLERELSELLGEDLSRSIRKACRRQGAETWLAALLAGFAIGASPGLRKILRSLLAR